MDHVSMLSRSFDDIADVVLNRKQIYSLDIDARLRDAANRLSARAFFELLSRLDDRDPTFGNLLSDLCKDAFKDDTYVIGFAEESVERQESEVLPEEPVTGAEYYFRLLFANADAAYYQFPLFPDFDRDYIVGGARKQSGEWQYIRLELSEAGFLQTFIEECRRNPHFERIEECSADDFREAPSNAE
jgi:hypothetical protein